MKKKWHNKIKDHIEYWSEKLEDRSWWPRYVYYFNDVSNAVSIIKEGKLYSRELAEKYELMVMDCASSRIIQQTRQEYLKLVR